MSKTSSVIKYILTVLFVISLIPLYIIGLYSHPSVDDYYYGTKTAQVWQTTHSAAEVIRCSFDEMVNTYYEWQGNFSAIFLMRLQPGIFGEEFYFLTPFILLTVYIVCSLFFFHTVMRKIFLTDSNRSWIISISVTFVSMQLANVPSDSFYWYNGSIYYTFFYSLMLLLFALMIRLRTAHTAGLISISAVCIILAFLIGGSNYATALFTAIILALSAGAALYYTILKKNTVITPRHTFVYVILAFSVMAGLFISMCAPGNSVRQASVGGSTGIITTFLYTFAFGGYSLSDVLSAPCIVFFICISPALYGIAKQFSRVRKASGRTKGKTFRYPLIVLIFTFGLYCSQGTPVFYAQGLRIPYRLMNIIYFSAYSFIGFNLLYFLGWLGEKYADAPLTAAFDSALRKIRQSLRSCLCALALCLTVFLFACIGQIEVGETEYASGKAAFSKMPMSISAVYSLITGDAKRFDSELTSRSEYLASTKEASVSVPALTAYPELIFHTDITTDPADWRNAHLAMFYHKDAVWLQE